MSHEIDMPLFIVPLKHCPWCASMPELYMPYDDTYNTNGTWMWYVHCSNYDCNVKPKSRYVSIRKQGKLSTVWMRMKLLTLESYWNTGLSSKATHGKEVDLNKLISEYKKCL